MHRSKILETAEKYVSADRNQQYGEPEDNFSLVAEYWSVYIGGSRPAIDAFDVSMMMALLKVARLSRRPENVDSAIDLAGYAACAGEILADSFPAAVTEDEREYVATTVERARRYRGNASVETSNVF